MSSGSGPKPGVRRLHAAIIMDGNGRWAASRGLPRTAGHRAGAEAIRRVVTAASTLGIGTLTLYAFSQNNWNRPAGEVAGLLEIFEKFFRSERSWWVRRRVRVTVIGRRERFPSSLLAAIEACENCTHGGDRLHLRLALDYSGQDAILEAALRFRAGLNTTREEFSRLLANVVHADAEDQNVDFVIRTGREHRLSDFLLWEIAYAELFFSPRYWPDFGPEDLQEALEEFGRRERRFGALVSSPASLASVEKSQALEQARGTCPDAQDITSPENVPAVLAGSGGATPL